MSELILPETPFTMAEFEELNRLANLGTKHYRVIHKRFFALGLIRVRRHRGRGFAEDVWVRQNEKIAVNDLDHRLRQLRA